MVLSICACKGKWTFIEALQVIPADLRQSSNEISASCAHRIVRAIHENQVRRRTLPGYEISGFFPQLKYIRHIICQISNMLLLLKPLNFETLAITEDPSTSPTLVDDSRPELAAVPLNVSHERQKLNSVSLLDADASSSCMSHGNVPNDVTNGLQTKDEGELQKPSHILELNERRECEIRNLKKKYIQFIRFTDGKLPTCIQITNLNPVEKKIEINSSDIASLEFQEFLKLINYEQEKKWYTVKIQGVIQPLAGPVNVEEISVYERVNPGSVVIAIKETKVKEAMECDPKEYIKNQSGDSNYWTIGFLGRNGEVDNELYLVSCGHGLHMLDMTNHNWIYFSAYKRKDKDEEKSSFLNIGSNNTPLVKHYGTFDEHPELGIPYLVDISLMSLEPNILGNTNVDLHFRENFDIQGKIIEMEIFEGDMSTLDGMRVFVRGCKSGHYNETAQIIKGDIGSMNFNGKHVTGVFSIALVNGLNRVGTHGDSGALVYGFKDKKPIAIGLLYGRDDGKATNTDGKPIRATYCVSLQHAKNYLRKNHKIELCFNYRDSRTLNAFQVAAPVLRIKI